jgi:hypothetical protein
MQLVGSALDRAAGNQVYSFSQSAGEKPQQCIEEEERSLQADKTNLRFAPADRIRKENFKL